VSIQSDEDMYLFTYWSKLAGIWNLALALYRSNSSAGLGYCLGIVGNVPAIDSNSEEEDSIRPKIAEMDNSPL